MTNIMPGTVMTLLMVTKLISSTFLHEPSAIPIHPPKYENNSDFGFAMGFQSFNKKLIVGAPLENEHGSVYICDMSVANASADIKCEQKNITIPPASKLDKTVTFHLGASIATTSKHFLTCAPLWTIDMTESRRRKKGTKRPMPKPQVVGTCFFDGDHRYNGVYEQYLKKKNIGRLEPNFDTKTFVGGTGWTTLADETNNVMMVVKSSLRGDIASSFINDELQMKSMVLDKKSEGGTWIPNYYNLGFGITGGKFFDNKTVYAISMDSPDMRGVVEFLEYDPPHLKLMNSKIEMKAHIIWSKAIATKFGSVLAAADLDKDGLDDLLVAEPLLTKQDCVDCGALHVYLGGEMETMNDRHYLQILGTDDLGRLGSAIAVNDLDGDGLKEIFVSAPYADDGLGMVYIISGYEVYQKLQQKQKMSIELTELIHTQRVQRDNFRNLGFSLQVVSDTDENGCNELAVGAPGSGQSLLLKCIQVIHISLSSKVVGDKDVREQDLSFEMEVCAEVKYPQKPSSISALLNIKSSIIGEGVSIVNPEDKLNISCKSCSEIQLHCTNVSLKFNAKRPGDYTFISKAELLTDHIFNSSVFNTSWVVATTYSNLQTMKNISRHCKGDDCNPNLSMQLFWSHSKEEPYVVGSSDTERVIIEVFNNGSSSYEACVWVTVKGAQLSQLLDHNECYEGKDGYRCDLPRPLNREERVNIELLLKMDRTNEFGQLDINAHLHEKCSDEISNKNPVAMPIRYIYNTDDVTLMGNYHEKQFSALENINTSSVIDVQELLVTNGGNITWKNIYVKISTVKMNNTEKFKVTLNKYVCKEANSAKEFIEICHFDLMPNSTMKVIATTCITTAGLESHLEEKKLKLDYEAELYLTPTEDVKRESVSSILKFETELTISQTKFLIAIIAAVIALLILIVIFIVMYKLGFFKRNEKKKLLVHRESIRQRSQRRNTHISSVVEEHGAYTEGITNLDDIDSGDDDCVFHKDIISTTKNGNGVQIEAKAQVHS